MLAQEGLKPFGEARCRGDEVTDARMHAALAAERIREGVADPLERGRVVSGRDEHRDASITDRVELWARLAGRPATVRPSNAGDHVLGERPVADGRTRELKELDKLSWSTAWTNELRCSASKILQLTCVTCENATYPALGKAPYVSRAE